MAAKSLAQKENNDTGRYYMGCNPTHTYQGVGFTESKGLTFHTQDYLITTVTLVDKN